MIISLCGTSIEGRAEVASYLLSKGFGYYSIINEISAELGQSGEGSHPKRIAKFDQTLIQRHGKDYWVKKILVKISEENAVIDGIRLPEEARLLTKRKQSSLVGIYSPLEVKFDRARARESEGDQGGENQYGMELEELSAALKLIDFSVVYPSTNFNKRIDDIIRKTQKK